MTSNAMWALSGCHASSDNVIDSYGDS